jgi:hypothetical protein
MHKAGFKHKGAAQIRFARLSPRLKYSLALMPALVATYATAADVWSWQLSEPLDLSVAANVFDIDPDSVTTADVTALKSQGAEVIAYISVGTRETYRDDKGAFPSHVVGRTYGDWPDEKFLDIRQVDALMPIMRARFERAAAMGFDAIEPDNMDVYINDSGFDISAADTVTYVRSLADLAHSMGLKIGQKNVPELTYQLVGTLDFVVTEGCYADGWCDQVLPYIAAGKPVYAAEYLGSGVDWVAACAYARSHGISMILQDANLTGPAKETC